MIFKLGNCKAHLQSTHSSTLCGGHQVVFSAPFRYCTKQFYNVIKQMSAKKCKTVYTLRVQKVTTTGQFFIKTSSPPSNIANKNFVAYSPNGIQVWAFQNRIPLMYYEVNIGSHF